MALNIPGGTLVKNQRYLIGSHAGLTYLELDAKWRPVECRFLAEGHYYGIALRPDGGFAAIKEGKIIQYWSPDFKVVGVSDAPVAAAHLHQVAFANLGVYLTNTAYNSLIYWGAGGRIDQFHIDDKKTDENHLNSVLPCGAEIWAMLHNKQNERSELLVFDHLPDSGFTLKKRLKLWHRGCHNLYLDDDRLIYNASRNGKLIVANPKRNRIEREFSHEGCHTKGLSVTKEALVYGVSDFAERGKRHESNGKLIIKTPNSYAPMAEIEFASLLSGKPIGNINEVRCLSSPDFAHVRANPSGFNFKKIKLADQQPNVIDRFLSKFGL